MVPWVTLEISQESGLKDSFKIRSVLQGPTDVLQKRQVKSRKCHWEWGRSPKGFEIVKSHQTMIDCDL